MRYGPLQRMADHGVDVGLEPILILVTDIEEWISHAWSAGRIKDQQAQDELLASACARPRYDNQWLRLRHWDVRCEWFDGHSDKGLLMGLMRSGGEFNPDDPGIEAVKLAEWPRCEEAIYRGGSVELTFYMDLEGMVVEVAKGSLLLHPDGWNAVAYFLRVTPDLPPYSHGIIAERRKWMAYVAAFSMVMLHVRNAEITEIPSGRAWRRRAQKNNRPLVRIYDLVVRPLRRALMAIRDHIAEHGEGSILPLHLVAGHLKRYTAEKPLFGRWVGHWWWWPHMRGDVDNGETLHEQVIVHLVPDGAE